MHYRAISNRGSYFEVFEREGEIRESRLLLCALEKSNMAIQLAIKESGLFYYIYLNKLCPQEMFFFL